MFTLSHNFCNKTKTEVSYFEKEVGEGFCVLPSDTTFKENKNLLLDNFHNTINTGTGFNQLLGERKYSKVINDSYYEKDVNIVIIRMHLGVCHDTKTT